MVSIHLGELALKLRAATIQLGHALTDIRGNDCRIRHGYQPVDRAQAVSYDQKRGWAPPGPGPRPAPTGDGKR